MDSDNPNRELWHNLLHGDMAVLQRNRHLFKLIPSNPRCPLCNAPFGGVGRPIMQTLFNRRPSIMNPRYCSVCDNFAAKYPGGAEVETTMLFADVRGSTRIAETISPSEFTRLLNRFYAAATSVLIDGDAWIDKLVGDEVIALFVRGFVGPDHARAGIETAQRLRKAVGYESKDRPFLPIGIGVHTDTVYVGVVGSEGVTDITALGDGMNTTARLVANAAAGEILVSEAAYAASGLSLDGLEVRELTVKGRTEPVRVRVFGAGQAVPEA